MHSNQHNKVRKLVLAAMFTALTTLATALPQIPVGYGYIHLGDGVIFASAILLGPWAAVVGGIGSALADLIGGYAIYAPATLVIKAGMGLVAAKVLSGDHGNEFLRYLLGFVAAEIVMIAGYFAYEIILYDIPTAALAVAFNLVQAVGGVIVGMVLAPIAKRLGALQGNNNH